MKIKIFFTFQIWMLIMLFGFVSKSSAQIKSNVAKVSFSPSNTTFKGNGVVSMQVKSEGGKISGIDLKLDTIGDINITKLGPVTCDDKPGVFYEDIVNTPATQPAKLIAILVKKSEDLCNTLTIPMNLTSSGGKAELKLNTQTSQISGNIDGYTYSISATNLKINDGGSDIPNIPPPPSDDLDGDVNIKFLPKMAKGTVEGTVYQNLVIQARDSNTKISAWDVVVQYSGSAIKIGSIGKPRSFNSGIEDDIAKVTEENDDLVGADLSGCNELSREIMSGNKFRVAYACVMSDESLPSRVVIPVKLRGVNQGTSTGRVISAEVVGNADGEFTVGKSSGSVTIGGGEIEPNPTDEPGGVGVTLDMALRLQGVPVRPQRPQTLNVKVGLGDGGLSKPVFSTGQFTVDEEGLWRGSVSFNVPARSGYKVLVKGGKHIQKKICDLSPTESVPGIYVCDRGKISLKAGKNTMNFSGIVLLAGDLPEQDGIVNAYDLALIKNNFGQTDDETLRVCDLNFDGACRSDDYGIVIRALSVRRDEP